MASGCRFEWRPPYVKRNQSFISNDVRQHDTKLTVFPGSLIIHLWYSNLRKASFCRDSPKYEGARNGFDWSPPWHSKKGNPKSTHPSRNILHLRSQCNCFGGLLLISTDSPDSSKAKMYGFTRRQKRLLHNQQYWQYSTYNRRESTRLVGKCRPPKHLANSPGKIPATLTL